ncbi:alpha/beta hydrolase fold domain-containing protein [Altererythrobacter salegens]|uniref:Alpha/beta hydrolase fold domain-containing protein n=1 Tax=Croceibacterium salegens TaxID=1737568 RepID=A0A6I4SUX3_9SPHN|nr:alpha/beta hydrolase fold domain-containing protein [Croceibacterium salegens]MXO59954.1 alpha/beta hydrolase fold domain-containing protein [Croceibacterium salegens]
MTSVRRPVAIMCGLAAGACLLVAPAAAQDPVDDRISKDGAVQLDGVTIPLSPLMSEEAREYMRHVIVDKPFGAALPDIREERKRQDGIMFDFLAPMRERYAVDVAEETIGGIVTDVVTPAGGIAPENADRVLINLHGGGFVTGGRSASLVESVPLAALMKIKVISIDYRMAPEYQFPAASEDVEKVYREVLKHYDASRIGLFGCSAGGFLAAQSIAWFEAHDLPNPAAVGVFCASLGGYFGGDMSAIAGPLNGMLPPLVRKPGGGGPPRSSAPGYLDAARRDDPLAYPVASIEVMKRFPPTLFISGTRSFEMSMALDSHNKLAAGGVDSQFHAWDSMNHAFFYNSELPESREAYAIMVDFFEKHLAD